MAHPSKTHRSSNPTFQSSDLCRKKFKRLLWYLYQALTIFHVYVLIILITQEARPTVRIMLSKGYKPSPWNLKLSNKVKFALGMRIHIINSTHSSFFRILFSSVHWIHFKGKQLARATCKHAVWINQEYVGRFLEIHNTPMGRHCHITSFIGLNIIPLFVHWYGHKCFSPDVWSHLFHNLLFDVFSMIGLRIIMDLVTSCPTTVFKSLVNHLLKRRGERDVRSETFN